MERAVGNMKVLNGVSSHVEVGGVEEIPMRVTND